MSLKLQILEKEDIKQFKRDMQKAFQMGAIEGGFPDDCEILPEEDINRSLNNEKAVCYKAVENGEMVGGAIIVIDAEKNEGHLDFLYVKHGIQSKGIGKFIWFEIEKLHPEIKLWKTCTPYFEKRNIHFYVNVCGFYIVEFFNKYHKDPNEPEMPDAPDGYFDGMFEFSKEINL